MPRVPIDKNMKSLLWDTWQDRKARLLKGANPEGWKQPPAQPLKQLHGAHPATSPKSLLELVQDALNVRKGR